MKKNIDITNFDFLEILNNLYDGIYISDKNGITLYVNDAYCRMTGIKREEIIGRTVKEIREEGRLYKGSVTEEVLKEKKVVSSVAKSLITGKDMLVTGKPIFDENGEIKLVVINDRDISDLKKLEEENKNYQEIQEKNNLKVNFFNKQQILNKDNSIEELPKNIKNIIKDIASSSLSIYIYGEYGTGKESLAEKIYENSSRLDYPLFKINCNDYTEEELENELFVSVGNKEKFCLLEMANKGTLYISGIDAMPIKIQKKFFKILNEKKLKKNKEKIIELDIRYIFSSSKNLKLEVEKKKFFKELYEKINIINLKLPPLRERKSELTTFVRGFLEVFAKKYDKKILLENEDIKLLEFYEWPGNIKELGHFIERLVISYDEKKNIKEMIQSMLMLYSDIFSYENLSLKDMLREIEKNIIIKVLNQYGNINRAAPILGISQPALSKKCKLLGIIK